MWICVDTRGPDSGDMVCRRRLECQDAALTLVASAQRHLVDRQGDAFRFKCHEQGPQNNTSTTALAWVVVAVYGLRHTHVVDCAAADSNGS